MEIVNKQLCINVIVISLIAMLFHSKINVPCHTWNKCALSESSRIIYRPHETESKEVRSHDVFLITSANSMLTY